MLFFFDRDETIKLSKNDAYKEASNLSNAKLLSKIIKELDECELIPRI